MKSMCPTILALFLGASGVAQRYSVADLRDFTKSRTEHIINQVEQPFEVRSVRGRVQFRNGPLEPLQNVLIEIEGPGSTRKIRTSHTDANGRFKISSVPSGQYIFKATLDGFQSVVGTIVVSKSSDLAKDITIEMFIGE